MDPCGTIATPGIYGTIEGNASKFVNTFTSTTPGSTCGYILWSPNYSCDRNPISPPVGQITNVIAANFPTSGINYFNSLASPIFSDPIFSANGSYCLSDPAGDFNNQQIAADMRVLSACMDCIYTGKMLDSQGEIGFIENLPLNAIYLPDFTGVAGNLISVNELFTKAASSQRLGVGVNTVRYRLDEHSNTFQDHTTGVFTVGQVGTAETRIQYSTKTETPSFYGFVWRGMDSLVSPNLRFTLTKSVEWRPAQRSGLAQTQPKTTGPSLVTQVQSELDRNYPGWWDRATDTAMDVSAKLLAMTIAGATASSSIRRLKGGL